jgi:hypothetical protein
MANFVANGWAGSDSFTSATWAGIFASIPFAIWFFLAIEGAAMAAEEAKEEADEKAAQTADPNNYMNRPRVYHISKQESGQWQVKLATGQKAIKLFSTQEEAINYAKGLVKTQGGSIRVHSLKGKMRKE